MNATANWVQQLFRCFMWHRQPIASCSQWMRGVRIRTFGDWGEPPDGGVQWPPFRNFGDTFYTYQILLDLKVEKGFAIRTEPHPRFYADRTGTVPVAVPALIRNWFAMGVIRFGGQFT